MNRMPWVKQIYLALIPTVPLGYIIIHGEFVYSLSIYLPGWRDDQLWTKFYISRSSLPATDSLKQFVELEMDQLEDVRHSKVC